MRYERLPCDTCGHDEIEHGAHSRACSVACCPCNRYVAPTQTYRTAAPMPLVQVLTGHGAACCMLMWPPTDCTCGALP